MNKGQSSFEVLMVTLAVIVTSTFILGGFFDLGDQTFALAILKADIMEQLDQNHDFYVLKKIYYEQESTNKIVFDVIVVDDTINQHPICRMDLNSSANKIINQTKYNDLTIFVACSPTKVQVYP